MYKISNPDSFDVLLNIYWQEFEKRKNLTSDITGISTGFPLIDAETDGFCAGDYWIILGDSRIGKSSLALNFALNAAKANASVLYCVTEMSPLRLIEKILSIESGIFYKKLRKPKFLNESEQKVLQNSSEDLKKLPMKFIAGGVISIAHLDSWLKNGNYNIVFVDYIQQLLEAQGQDWLAGLQTASFRLQELKTKYNLCMVALSQINKQGQKQQIKKHKTELWAAKGSSTMSQNADNILILDRNYADEETKRELRIQLDKVRYGDSGKVVYSYFDLENGRISPMLSPSSPYITESDILETFDE